MKTISRLIIAVLSSSAVLASCSKESIIERNFVSADGVRVITATFGNTAKSQLDGLQPKFVNGDKIMVFNEFLETPEECTISVVGNSASFSTTLSGALTAVYPSTAAKTSGNECVGILVPTVQDGSFASANIAVATIDNDGDKATFVNRTAVFKITPGAGSGTKYVEVITAGPEIANSIPSGSEYSSYHKIHVSSTSEDAVYVSILVPSGLQLRDLSFADGANIKTVLNTTTSIEVNSIYYINAEGWNEPYVELAGMKWATRNIGAAAPGDAGDYFAWGAVEVPYDALTGTVFSFKSAAPSSYSNTTWKPDDGFYWANAQYSNGIGSPGDRKYYFTKYVPSEKASQYGYNGFSDNKIVLDLEDDAANANWGGSWRIPTKDEFNTLIGGSIETGWDDTDKGFIVGPSSNRIFMPTAGCGNKTEVKAKGVGGYYWLSSLHTTTPNSGASFSFVNEGKGLGLVFVVGSDSRIYGQSVRAVSE